MTESERPWSDQRLLHRTPDDFQKLETKPPTTAGDLLRRLLAGVLMLVWGITALLITFWLPGPWSWEGSPPLLAGFLYLLLGLFVTVAIHEGGHVLAGALTGHRLVFVTVGPLRLARELDGLRLSFSRNFAFYGGGVTSSFTVDEAGFWRRQLWYVAGGPLATFLQLLVLVGLGVMGNGRILPGWMVEMHTMLTYSALAALPLSLWPRRVNHLSTDGATILKLLKEKEKSPHTQAIHLLFGRSFRGERPRTFAPALLAQVIAADPDSDEALTGHFLRYYVALDGGRVAEAAAALDQCLTLVQAKPTYPNLVGLCLEAAFLEGWYGRDADLARAWLDVIPMPKNTFYSAELRQTLLRAEGAILLAEGNVEEGRERLQESRALLAHTVDQGGAKMEADLLAMMLAEATAVVPAPTT